MDPGRSAITLFRGKDRRQNFRVLHRRNKRAGRPLGPDCSRVQAVLRTKVGVCERAAPVLGVRVITACRDVRKVIGFAIVTRDLTEVK